MKENKSKGILILLVVILVVFILFPSHNSSNDAYDSAADIKNHWILLMPHHLLHNVLLHFLIQPITLIFPKVDILALSKVYSALFSVLNLGVLFLILKKLKPQGENKLLYIALAAFSFGVWRFSTDSEFYILPIFFSLLGSLYFIKYLKKPKNYFILLSGIFAAFACVIHQIHFFWWLGLLIGTVLYIRKLKVTFLFILPAILVPIAYIIAVYTLGEQPTITNITHYILFTYYSGDAPIEFGLMNFFFFFVGLFRTFLQLFPLMLILLKKSYFFYLPLVFSIIYLIYLGKIILRKQLLKSYKNSSDVQQFGKTHLIILILQMLFALFSMGNSEFMVMIPTLMAILLYSFYDVNKRILWSTLLLMIFWNMVYGIFPLYHYQLSDGTQLAKTIHKNQDAVYIVKQYDVWRIYAYEYGVEKYKNIIPEDKANHFIIDSFLKQGVPVYTNVIDAPNIINRRSFSSIPIEENLFQSFQQTKIDSTATFYGNSYLYKLALKE